MTCRHELISAMSDQLECRRRRNLPFPHNNPAPPDSTATSSPAVASVSSAELGIAPRLGGYCSRRQLSPPTTHSNAPAQNLRFGKHSVERGQPMFTVVEGGCKDKACGEVPVGGVLHGLLYPSTLSPSVAVPHFRLELSWNMYHVLSDSESVLVPQSLRVLGVFSSALLL
jgi:hypothetical protein